MNELTYIPFVHDTSPELEAWWIEDEQLGSFLAETESRRQLKLQEESHTRFNWDKN